MIDGLGNVQSILLIGGSSPIGLAVVDRLVGPRLSRVVLAGEPTAALSVAADHVRRLGVAHVETPVYEATRTQTHAHFVDSIFDETDIDVVVLADELTIDQATCELDPSSAVELAIFNYVSSVSVGLHVARRLRQQGHGVLVVLSSVSGERARKSDFIYGSSKAGLDVFAVGLGESLRGSGAKVVVVRLGQVDAATDYPQAGALVANPQEVASAIRAAIRSRRSDIVYVPSSLRTVMSGLRHLPKPVFRRLPL